jgi:hypothetical protein
MKNMTLDKTVKEYIINCIDSDGYDIPLDLMREAHALNIPFEEYTKGKLQFLYDTFIIEYGWSIPAHGEVGAFREWTQGLPSCFNIEFTNHGILVLAETWGSIPANATERQKDKILENWFNFIAVKTFQLFKKYKINQ